MTTNATKPITWADIRSEFARCSPRIEWQDVARVLGMKKQDLSLRINDDVRTQPTPEFAERVLDAIRAVAGERAA